MCSFHHHLMRLADTLNNICITICHLPQSLTICLSPPSVLALQYSICSAVIDLVCCYLAHVIDTPNNVHITICHLTLSLTICQYPPSVLALQYSICSTVIDLIPSSILDSNTGFGYTCLFGAVAYSLNSPSYTSCRMLFTIYLL